MLRALRALAGADSFTRTASACGDQVAGPRATDGVHRRSAVAGDPRATLRGQEAGVAQWSSLDVALEQEPPWSPEGVDVTSQFTCDNYYVVIDP
jgi:hypothetical protein